MKFRTTDKPFNKIRTNELFLNGHRVLQKTKNDEALIIFFYSEGEQIFDGICFEVIDKNASYLVITSILS